MLNIIKGFLIGVALVVPGLSGSVFAIILGLYEKGLFAVANFKKSPAENAKFLLPIAFGAGVGIIFSAGLIVNMVAALPTFSYLFFIGLVTGSFPLIWRRIKDSPKKYLLFAALAFVLVVILGQNSAIDNTAALEQISSLPDFAEITLAGAVTLSMMMVPGISGSIVIVLLGHFGTIYNAVAGVLSLIAYTLTGQFEAAAETLSATFVLVPFALGAVIGLVVFAKIMTYLLKNFEKPVYCCVMGALSGTIVILFNMGVVFPTPGFSIFTTIILGLICLGIGIACTLFLDGDKWK